MPVHMFRNGAEVTAYLDEQARLNNQAFAVPRKLRVYVMGHKALPQAEAVALIDRADIDIAHDAWKLVLIVDRARYDWINR